MIDLIFLLLTWNLCHRQSMKLAGLLQLDMYNSKLSGLGRSADGPSYDCGVEGRVGGDNVDADETSLCRVEVEPLDLVSGFRGVQ